MKVSRAQKEKIQVKTSLKKQTNLASTKQSRKSVTKTPVQQVIKFLGTNKAVVVKKATRKNTLTRHTKRAVKSILLSPFFHTTFKVVVGLAISYGVIYHGYTYAENTFAHDVVVSKSEIIARVSKLAQLPTGDPEAVVRVQDAETLKKQNPFYENVHEGDYIIMYPKVAVIYSLRSNYIVALKREE
jgi:hypothetical protein